MLIFGFTVPTEYLLVGLANLLLAHHTGTNARINPKQVKLTTIILNLSYFGGLKTLVKLFFKHTVWLCSSVLVSLGLFYLYGALLSLIKLDFSFNAVFLGLAVTAQCYRLSFLVDDIAKCRPLPSKDIPPDMELWSKALKKIGVSWQALTQMFAELMASSYKPLLEMHARFNDDAIRMMVCKYGKTTIIGAFDHFQKTRKERINNNHKYTELVSDLENADDTLTKVHLILNVCFRETSCQSAQQMISSYIKNQQPTNFGSEKRTSNRALLSHPIKVDYTNGSADGRNKIREISKGGCFMQANFLWDKTQRWTLFYDNLSINMEIVHGNALRIGNKVVSGVGIKPTEDDMDKWEIFLVNSGLIHQT